MTEIHYVKHATHLFAVTGGYLPRDRIVRRKFENDISLAGHIITGALCEGTIKIRDCFISCAATSQEEATDHTMANCNEL